jgi:hypothetical protein
MPNHNHIIHGYCIAVGVTAWVSGGRAHVIALNQCNQFILGNFSFSFLATAPVSLNNNNIYFISCVQLCC